MLTLHCIVPPQPTNIILYMLQILDIIKNQNRIRAMRSRCDVNVLEETKNITLTLTSEVMNMKLLK